MRRQTVRTTRRAFLLAGLAAILLLWPAYAQENTPHITIDNVDASQFPSVVIELAVADELGVPVPQLSAADFQVFEDGRKVSAGSISLEADESRPIGIVFAVDLSTEVADLEEIKAGLSALVARMRTGDQALLLTFDDGVQVAQSLTSNRDELLAAINSLGVQGNYTSLNRATVEAMNRAELLTVDRRAVVIITDSVENINSLPLADVYTRADQVDVPLYLFAYSPKSQPTSAMEAYGLRIKAKPIVADTATAARLRLLTLGSLFERGYRLHFLSGLQADGGEHSISVNLVGGVNGSSTNADPIFSRVSLVAQPGPVEIILAGVQDEQTVGGVIDLVPTINAPGPIRSVEYLIDGRTVGALSNAPYAYAWDTGSLLEGSHVVGVRAVDSAGNQGESYVTVTVVDPLKLEATVDRARVYIGDEVYVTVNVEALAGVGAVDFLVDGVRLDRRSEPPYLFPLNSSTYPQGEHIITIQASDLAGNVETTKFSMDLLPPAPRFIFTSQTWLRIFAAVAIILSIVLVWLLLGYLALLSRRRRRRRFSLALDNLGNLVSSYLLRIDDPKGILRFYLLHQGMKLSGRTVRDWVPLAQDEWENLQFRAQTVLADQVTPVYAAPAPVPTGSGQIGGGGGIAGSVGTAREDLSAGLGRAKAGAGAGLSKLKSAGQATTKVAGIAGAGASMLYALGGFLPASWGGAALRQAAQGSMGAYRGVRSAERVQRTAGQIQSAAGGPSATLTAARQHEQERAKAAGFGTANMQEVMEKGGGAQAQAVAATAPPIPAPAAVNGQGTGTSLALRSGRAGPATNGHGPYQGRSALPPNMPDLRYDANGVPYKQVTRKIDDVWVETPTVEPGDSLFLELIIEPTRPRRRQSVPFRIASKSIEAEEKPLVIQEATVNVPGWSWFSWLLPLLVIAVGVGIVYFMLTFLLTDLGMIG